MSEGRIRDLEASLTRKDREILKLRAHCQLLERAVLNLETEYRMTKEGYNIIMSKENYFKSLEAKFNEKDETIFKLNQEIDSIDTKHEKILLAKEVQYEKDVSQARYYVENVNQKIEGANKLEKTFKCISDENTALKKIINDFEEQERKRVKEREVHFEKEISQIKKKMLDYIRDGQKNGYAKNSKQGELNIKLNQMHNGQLLNELEYQSYQIETLLKEREHLDKVLLELRNDITIHVKVEKALTEKNKTYTDMIKSLSFKLQKGEDNNSHNAVSAVLSPIACHNKNFGMTSNSLQMPIIENNSNNNINMGLKHMTMNNGFTKDFGITSNSFKNIFQKELIKKQRENDSMKIQYDTLYAKHQGLESKFSNIFKLFNDALEKVYNDPQFLKVKEIYVNLEEFQTCDFSLMTPEQKYSAIMLIMNYILPIVNQEIVNSELRKTSFDKIQRKFYVNKDDSNSMKTFASSKATNRSTRHMNFKSLNDFPYKANKSRATNEKSPQKLYSLLRHDLQMST